MNFLKRIKTNRGMSYAELIIVLSIFATVSSVAIFNYGSFQASVKVKNLTSDVALQIVQAQKDSINGRLPTNLNLYPISNWKPSYGVYFSTDSSKRDQIVYFADLGNNGTRKEINTVWITKGDFISAIDKCTETSCPDSSYEEVSISFKRPNSEPIFYLNDSPDTLGGDAYVRITVESSQEKLGYIKIYPSGRIEVQ